VAWTPFGCLGALLLLGGIAYLQVGHWPLYARPDPKDLALFGLRLGLLPWLIVAVAALGTVCAGGIMGMVLLLETLGDAMDGKWNFESQKRVLAHGITCASGFILFWAQLGSMLNWLAD